jgi:non-ribosomal peptide synthetase component F
MGSGTGDDMPRPHLKDTIFEQLARTGDRLALSDQFGSSLTGTGLRALAHTYQAPIGVSSISVHAEHTCSTVARILACIRLGVAFVPFESTAPDFASPHLVMHCDDFLEREPVGNVAYVLPTSGSTGSPKHVVQGYVGACYHAVQYAASIMLNRNDKLALLASLTTDASLMDMFGGLIAGAQVCMFNPRKKAWKGLQDWVGDQGITVLHMTPTLLRMAFSSPNRNLLRTVRCVVLGGEPAMREDWDIFKQAFRDNAVLVNGYGPSECTTAMQWVANEADLVEPYDSLPMGVPIGETQIRVANDGELLLASPGLFWGYRGDELLNQLSFLLSQFQRWYYTGDLVEKLPVGDRSALFFVGRKDGRRKVRGMFARGEDLGTSMKSALPCE